MKLVFAIVALTLLMAPSASADTYKRNFRWSGYTWKVRHTTSFSQPGYNLFGNGNDNVRVMPDGQLRLAISSRWKSVEISQAASRKQHFGYGRFRWVINSDLNFQDMHRIMAVYVWNYVQPYPHGEQDLEFSRWGDQTALPGWWVSWSYKPRIFGTFTMSSAAPYTLTIWRLRKTVTSQIRDANGTLLLNNTIRPRARRDDHFLTARMSYWLWNGYQSAYTAPPPPIYLKSFKWTPMR